MLAFAFSLAVEVERELISSRTREALARKKAEGKVLSRPRGVGKSKLDGRVDEIRELLKHKVVKVAIARILGTSRGNCQPWFELKFLSDRLLTTTMDSITAQVASPREPP